MATSAYLLSLRQGTDGSLDSLSVQDYILYVKELVGYLTEHKALAIIMLAALLFAGFGLAPVVDLFTGAENVVNKAATVDPSSGKFTIYTETPTRTAIVAYIEPGDTQMPAEGGVWPTDTPGASVQETTILGQYCQDGKSYTNVEIGLPGTFTIMEGTYDSSTEPTLAPDAAGGGVGGLIPLPITSSVGLPVAFIPPEMRCVLVKDDLDSALFNCTGLENSTVPILVEGKPVNISFIACGGNEPKQEECPRRDCR